MDDIVEGQEPQQEQEQVENSTGQEPAESDLVRQLRAEAASYRKKLRAVEQQLREREEATLSDAERMNRRLAELEREREQWQQERRSLLLRNEVLARASQYNVVDPDAVYRLLDTNALEFDDQGVPQNLDDAIRALIKAKPYLVAQSAATAQQSPTNPPTQRGNTFTTSQIADRKFWEQHRDEILAAMAEGRILPD